MNKNIAVGFFLLFFPMLIALGQEQIGDVPEIAAPDLGDAAIASFDAQGRPVIYYNPNIYARFDPLVIKFVRAHELAHHKFKHSQRAQYETNPFAIIAEQASNEIEADHFATVYWMRREPTVVGAMIAMLRDPLKASNGDWTHFPTPVRAAMIEQWSKSPLPPIIDVKPDKPFSFFAEAAKSNFEKLKTAKSIIDGSAIWDSAVEFPNFKTPTIQRTSGNWMLTTDSSDTDLKTATALFGEMIDEIKEELGDSWVYEEHGPDPEDVWAKYEPTKTFSARLKKSTAKCEIRLGKPYTSSTKYRVTIVYFGKS